MATEGEYNALLFDTRSIQRYIFSSNRLRTNIGASYLVERLFYDILIDEVLRKIYPNDEFFFEENAHWKDTNKKEIGDIKGAKVAYIGGGNALVLFNKNYEDLRRKVVQNFTEILLAKRPGIKVGVAFGNLKVNADGKMDDKDISALYATLKDNQNRIFPNVNIPYHGLTLLSDISGESATFYDKNKKRYISHEDAVKDKFSDEGSVALKNKFKTIFEKFGIKHNLDDYEFPASLDELGQREGNDYIAIIHADGNNMGEKFRAYKGLEEKSEFSDKIRRKTEGAFARLLSKIILAKREGIFDKILTNNGKDNKEFLPIRPIILGGDDITFITPANLAILFTKTLLKDLYFGKEFMDMENSTECMDACAGIAILNTSYPFFRGYELAEELCSAAKQKMRAHKSEKDRNSSWLDFAILHGEQAPTLEEIRAEEYGSAYTKDSGALHFGPYIIAPIGEKNIADSRFDLENMLNCIKYFEKEKFPANKIKDLRFILQKGKSDVVEYLNQLNHLGLKLPQIPAWETFLGEDLWSKGAHPKTPYVDAIEMMDFYDYEVEEKWRNLTWK